MHTEGWGFPLPGEPESSACKTPTETSPPTAEPQPNSLQTPDKCTYGVSSGALGEGVALSGLGQTRMGRWLGSRGFKGTTAVMSASPLIRLWPPPVRGNRLLPHLWPPSDSAQAPYLGKDTKLEQSEARDILCVLWGWSRRGHRVPRCSREPPEKAFYGQDHEGFPCRLDLGLLL